MKAEFDKDVCIITLAAALALSGASLIVPTSTAFASTQKPAVSQVSPVAVTAATQAASTVSSTPAAAVDDGDGDELLEHWSDPKYIHEQHYQLMGMFFMFMITAGVAVRHKMYIRRLARG